MHDFVGDTEVVLEAASLIVQVPARQRANQQQSERLRFLRQEMQSGQNCAFMLESQRQKHRERERARERERERGGERGNNFGEMACLRNAKLVVTPAFLQETHTSIWQHRAAMHPV